MVVAQIGALVVKRTARLVVAHQRPQNLRHLLRTQHYQQVHIVEGGVPEARRRRRQIIAGLGDLGQPVLVHLGVTRQRTVQTLRDFGEQQSEVLHLFDVGANIVPQVLQHGATGLVEQRRVELVHLLHAFDDLAEGAVGGPIACATAGVLAGGGGGGGTIGGGGTVILEVGLQISEGCCEGAAQVDMNKNKHWIFVLHFDWSDDVSPLVFDVLLAAVHGCRAQFDRLFEFLLEMFDHRLLMLQEVSESVMRRFQNTYNMNDFYIKRNDDVCSMRDN